MNQSKSFYQGLIVAAKLGKTKKPNIINLMLGFLNLLI